VTALIVSCDERADFPVESAATTASVFTDVTHAAGIGFVHHSGATGSYHLREIMSGGGGFFDFDDDGDLDIYLVQSGVNEDPTLTSQMYRNDGAGQFTDVTAESGTAVSGYGMGMATADWDLDGDLDLYVTCVGPDVALENQGDGTFVDVTARSGLSADGYSSSAAFLDFDRDGWIDLYVTRYIVEPEILGWCASPAGQRDYCTPLAYPAATDVLFRNLGGGRFEDVSQASGIVASVGYGLALLTFDFDDDGWVDIYVANDQSPAFLWRNQGDGRFREVALEAGCAYNYSGEAIAGMGTAAKDFDGDGAVDLFVTNISLKHNLFFRNEGGNFEDVSLRWGQWSWITPFTGFGVAAFDQDLDGHHDLFIANGSVARRPVPGETVRSYRQPNQFCRQDPLTGVFASAADAIDDLLLAPAVSRGVAQGDYDNDGDVDLLICRNNAAPQLLRNEQTGLGHWLIVIPKQSRGQQPLLHTRVTASATGRQWVGEVSPQQSYLSSGDWRVHFGLGDVDTVTLTIRWPDASIETWSDVATDRMLTLYRGTGSAEGR
jgi:hypothetical protein